MKLEEFLQQLRSKPDGLLFADTMDVIDANYQFTETAFSNGDVQNAACENNGSCKVFAFADLHGLSKQETLQCFGQFYRDVLVSPDGGDHQNIRNFMRSGWNGIEMAATVLS